MSDIPQHMLTVRAQVAQRFILGSGIEIGALHCPLEIGSGVRVKYVDRLPLDKLREHYPELQGHKLVEPDILDDGEVLSSIEDDTLDFIIANHMLEHCENPLGAIRNHLRKVRPGGILYYAIPEKTQGFDSPREITSYIHLVKDDLWGPEISRLQHFWEWVTFVNQIDDPKKAVAKVEELKKRNYNIHFHVWDERGFREFVKGAQKYLHNTFDIEYLARNNTELITVFRRIDRAGRSKNKPLGMISQGRSNLQILAEQIEAAQKAHSEERDRLEGELRRSLQERETEINQARKTIDGLVREIDQARSNMHILSDQIDQARQAHLERDRLEMELRQALKVQDGRTRELTTQLEFLSNDLEQLRKSWSHRLFHPLEAYLRGKG